jgi:serine/threonine protein kinase
MAAEGCGVDCPACPDGWAAVIQVGLLTVMMLVAAWTYVNYDKEHQSQAAESVKGIGVIQELLMTMCDGYLLLRQDGSLASEDPGAEFILGGLDSDTRKAFKDQIAGDGLMPGQRRIRLPNVQVEVYTLQTPMSASTVRTVLLTGRMRKPEGSLANMFLCCLRCHDDLPTVMKTMSSGQLDASPAEAEEFKGTVQRKDSSGSIPMAPSRGSAIRPVEYPCDGDSELMSATQTQVATGQQMPQCLPNTWENITAVGAVGLGVIEYEKVRAVGTGGQGTVWQVKDPDNEGDFLAQKEIPLKGQLWHRDFPVRLKNADREIRALKQLSWARGVVVPIVDCWIQTNFEQVNIVMEWLPVTLGNVLHEHRASNRHLLDQDVTRWLARMACGIAAIHDAGLIHRDIKPANILLDEKRRSCKIADLGVSRTTSNMKNPNPVANQAATAATAHRRDLDDSKSMLSSVFHGSVLSLHGGGGSVLSNYTERPGTSEYMSPEALSGGNYGTPMDIFGLGGVLVEMLTLQTPPAVPMGEAESRLPELSEEWMALDSAGRMVGLMRSAGGGKVCGPPPVTDRRRDLRRLCLSMLTRTPGERPSAKDCVNKLCLKDAMEDFDREYPKFREKLFRSRGVATPERTSRRALR